MSGSRPSDTHLPDSCLPERRLPDSHPPDLRQAHDAARAIGAAALGCDPGPMVIVESSSHHVYVGSGAVVKIIDAAGHTRLDRETVLASQLPAGLTAPLLGSGLHRLGTRDIRYACYARAPGAAPGVGLPGADGGTVRRWAQEAVRRLGLLHTWAPSERAARTLGEPLDHGGFVGRDALAAEVERLAALDRHRTVRPRLLAGVAAIAERAPLPVRALVPVHADCHWDNWLADDRGVTALLDFEWARFGEPADDWFFLARFSGPHMETVLDVIARTTGTSPGLLRARCEAREAAHLVSDLRIACEHPAGSARMAADRLRDLEELVVGRYWWRHAR
ncbi:phosphotransferase family protein [Streptomyces sp. NPDC059398]|uniref:phosphotransferase family protein n=1 Tax=Streptomyces sp. NPDC059398 TaxID=3346820 RepID=UPI0036B21621